MKRILQPKKIVIFIITVLLLITVPLIGLFLSPRQTVKADLYDDLKELEEELARIKRDKLDLDSKIQNEKNLQSSLTSQIYTLSNSIAQLELDIQEKEVDIEKKETEIKILEEEITEAGQLITNLGNEVEQLEMTANDIITTIYIDSKTNSTIDLLLTSQESASFMSQLQYHTALGAHDQNALSQLQDEKEKLEEEKKKMEEDKLEIEKLAEQIKKQKELLEKDKEQLSAQKAQKNSLLANSQVAAAYYNEQYENLSDEEIKMHAQLDYILQQIVKSGTKPKGYVVQGQIVATEASNGCSTGPHTHYGMAINNSWVNPCSYLPYRAPHLCSGNGSIGWPYNGTNFYITQPFHSGHMALDLSQGYGSYVVASHDGYYFEETPACSNSWCSVGCKSPTNPCIKVCENVDCVGGKITIYCHVNFL